MQHPPERARARRARVRDRPHDKRGRAVRGLSAPDGVVARLRAAGCVFAEDEARVLRSATGDPAELEFLLRRREAGEPLELVVGWAEFCGLRIAVAAGVFVPRRRTEFLAELSVAQAPRTALDLCCGTGTVAAVLADRLAGVEVYAADLDPAAVRCARRNLKCPVFTGDLFDALPSSLAGRLDVIAVNAPYVPSDQVRLMPREARLHEPAVALDGGADGVDLHRRVIADAARWLASDGALLIETSPDQAPLGIVAAEQHGLTAAIARDDTRDATVLEIRDDQPKRPCT